MHVVYLSSRLIGDFMQMLRDTQLLDDHLTPLAAHHVFGHTQLVTSSPHTHPAQGLCCMLTYTPTHRRRHLCQMPALAVAKMP